jgi:arylsulfatase A-like enzyme
VFGVRPSENIDGVSFLPASLGQPAVEPERELYFVRREGGPAYGGKTIEAFRRGDWKLLQDSPFAPLELYDLSADPQEKTNLAATHARVFQDLEKGLRKQIQIGGQTPWQPPKSAPVPSP